MENSQRDDLVHWENLGGAGGEGGGRGIGMGNTCKPMAVSLQCMAKFTTNKKKEKEKKKKRWEYQTTVPACLLRKVKKQQLEADMEQRTGSKLGKVYIKTVYCHPAYLTYMQSTPCEMPGWVKHKFESRLLGEIAITSDMQMTPPLCRKQRGIKEPLDEGERGEWKSWHKAQHSKNEDHGI